MSRLSIAESSTRFVHALLLSASFALSSSVTPVAATEVARGQFVFDRAPRLVEFSTTRPTSFAAGGTYQLTLTVPSDAGAPLQAVTISQAENAAKIGFALTQTQAVANGVKVPIAAIGGERGNELTIAFDQPIQPGATVTVSLLVDRSPGADGIYLFGVTAYPVGNPTNGLFLGYGRVALRSYGG